MNPDPTKPPSARRLAANRAAGKIGGPACLAKHGREHYVTIRAKRSRRSADYKRLPIYLRPEQVDFVERLAADTGQNRSAVLREAVDWFQDHWEAVKAEARAHRSFGSFAPGKRAPKK